MKRIFVPSNGVGDWKPSSEGAGETASSDATAALAACWEAADGALPKDVRYLLDASLVLAFADARPIVMLQGYGSKPPGSGATVRTDLRVPAHGKAGLFVISVGGATGDGLGDFVSDRLHRGAPDELARIDAMQAELELSLPLNACPMISIKHRCLSLAAGAILAAKEFGAETALMLIHSFSDRSAGFEDFRRFASLFGVSVAPDTIARIPRTCPPDLYIGWCRSDPKNADGAQSD